VVGALQTRQLGATPFSAAIALELPSNVADVGRRIGRSSIPRYRRPIPRRADPRPGHPALILQAAAADQCCDFTTLLCLDPASTASPLQGGDEPRTITSQAALSLVGDQLAVVGGKVPSRLTETQTQSTLVGQRNTTWPRSQYRLHRLLRLTPEAGRSSRAGNGPWHRHAAKAPRCLTVAGWFLSEGWAHCQRPQQASNREAMASWRRQFQAGRGLPGPSARR